MSEFTDMEVAALRAIFAETPDVGPALQLQLEASVVTERLNTGGGFFTTVEVADEAAAVESASVLGDATHAHVCGLDHGFTFILFMKRGKMHMLEGVAWGADTHKLDLAALQFEIYHEPVQSLQ